MLRKLSQFKISVAYDKSKEAQYRATLTAKAEYF